MRDFLYLRPSKIVGGLEREFSDLLIVLDGYAIPVQLRGQGSTKARQAGALRRWTTKQAVAVGRQASGACRTLSSTTVCADHPTRGPVAFGPGDLIAIHGLAIVEYDGTAFQTDQVLKHEDPNGTAIHYLSLTDLSGLIEAVGSLPDLLQYLDGRSRLDLDIRSWIGAEQDLYTSYLLDEGFDSSLTTSTVLLRAHSWTSTQRLDLQRTRSHDLFVRPINYAIEHLHERDPELESYVPDFMRGMIEPAEHRRGYLKMAAQLNRLHHRARQEVGGRIVEMEAKAKSNGTWYFYIFAQDDTPIVFVVSAEADRRRRAELLWPILLAVLLKTGRTSGMVVSYPTRNLNLGLLFLCVEDIDPAEFDGDPELKELISTVSEPKLIPVPKAPALLADLRFELLSQSG